MLVPLCDKIKSLLTSSILCAFFAWPGNSSGSWEQDEYQKLFDLVNLDLRMKAHQSKNLDNRKVCNFTAILLIFRSSFHGLNCVFILRSSLHGRSCSY
jgi:hypothetical protein